MNLAHEIYRKSLHFSLVLVPVFFCYFGRWRTLLILAPLTVLMVLLDYFRRENLTAKKAFFFLFGKLLRPYEVDGVKLCGASTLLLGGCINFLFFSKEVAVTSFLILIVSDGLSAIVGKAVVSPPFFEKTRAAAASFAVSALIILITCGIIFEVHVWFYIFGIFSVFCVSVIESRPNLLDMDDNLSIPLVFSLLMTGFGFMWG